MKFFKPMLALLIVVSGLTGISAVADSQVPSPVSETAMEREPVIGGGGGGSGGGKDK